jgi:WD40 repeat protein
VFNPSTGDIASGTNYGRIPVQNPRSGKLSATISTAGGVSEFEYDTGPVNALAFTSDGAILVTAGSLEFQLRDAKDGRLLWYHGYDWNSSSLSTVTISPDSRLLISVDSDGNVEFWGIPDR